MNTISYPPASSTNAGVFHEARTVSNTWRRVSWGAIIAGVVIAMVLQLVLSLLGAAIGLSTIDPLKYSSPDPATFGIGAGIWWIVSSVISLFAAGWVAAHLAGAPDKTDASLHGLLTWGLATIVTAYLIASAVGAAVSGGAKLVGGAVNTTANVASQNEEGIKRQLPTELSMDALKNEAQQRLAQATNTQPAANGSAAPTAEQKAAAEAKARQVADETAKRSSQVALAALLALVLGALAATFGGSIAGRRFLVDDGRLGPIQR